MHVGTADNSTFVPPVNGAPKTTTVFSDSNVGIGAILDDAIGSRPEASARADQLIAEAVQNHGAFIPSRIDKAGTAFDPSIHESDSAGNPRVSADGLFRRKRGRKPGRDYSGTGNQLDAFPAESSSGDAMGGEIIPAGNALTRQEAVREGREKAHLIFAFGQALFDAGEWQPLTKAQTGGIDEKENLAKNLADYFEIRGTVKLPPEIGLAIALGGVIIPRVSAPGSRSKAKVQSFASRFGGWFRLKKRRKNGAPEAVDTPGTEPTVIPAEK